MRAPASVKMRRSTDGIVTMVGPMSKRKPSLAELRGLAAEPIVAFEKDDFVAARGEHAGGGEPAEAAADDADWFHEFVSAFDFADQCADEFAESRRSARDRVRAPRGCRKRKAAHRPGRVRRNAGCELPRRTATTCGNVISSKPFVAARAAEAARLHAAERHARIGGRNDEIVDERRSRS